MWKIAKRLYSAAGRLHDAAPLHNAARLFGAALLGCSALLSGCVNDDNPFDQPNKAVVQLSVGSDLTGDTTGELTDAEGKLYTLRVYAFVGGRPAGHYFSDQVTMQEGRHTFYMDLTTYSAGAQTVDFYVVANEGAMTLHLSSSASGPQYSLSETTGEADLKNLWFNNYLRTNLETLGLPMCCQQSQTLDFADLGTETAPAGSGHDGHRLLNTKIAFELIRPTAKIGVFAAKPAGETGTLRVTKIQMIARGINVRNYLMAQTDETLKAILPGGRDVDVAVAKDAEGNAAEVTAELAETADRTKPENYTPVTAEAYYAFENAFANGGDWQIEGPDRKGHALRIEYEYEFQEDGQTFKRTHTREVFLPRVERNHYYAICCLIHNNGEIFITYNVADWSEKPAYEINLDYPTYSNPMVHTKQLTLPEGNTYSQPEVWYDPTGSDESANATFRFELTAPVNQRWRPVLDLNGATKEDYQVDVYQQDASGKMSLVMSYDNPTQKPEDNYCVASDREFYITVKATSQRVNHEVGLGIFYERSWNPNYGSPLLLINGRTGYLRYEHTQYAEYIVIKQVDVPTEQAN